jgi:hypothetical protein
MHTNYNWDHVDWHGHKLRKLELGSTAYWHVVNGKHLFVVVN